MVKEKIIVITWNVLNYRNRVIFDKASPCLALGIDLLE